MIVVRRDLVEAYFRKAAGSAGVSAGRTAYGAWLSIAQATRWRTPMDVKRSHPKASILRGGRVVFNIKGNSYRLVTQINYAAETVEIRFFGSHAEYDEIDAGAV